MRSRLDGACFDDPDPCLNEELRKIRSQCQVCALPAEGFVLEFPQVRQGEWPVNAGAVVRLGQRQNSAGPARNALHFAEGSQWVLEPQEKIMTASDVESLIRVRQRKGVGAGEQCARRVNPAINQSARIQIQTIDRVLGPRTFGRRLWVRVDKVPEYRTCSAADLQNPARGGEMRLLKQIGTQLTSP